MKVNLQIVGAQNAGTDIVEASLKDHPQIAMSKPGGLHFFDQPEGASEYGAYEANFKAAPGVRIWGDATTNYMFCPDAPGRIREYNPETRIVALLRDPAARAIAHWRQAVEQGHEDNDFSSAIRAEAGRSGAAKRRGSQTQTTYIERSRYGVQIARLQEHFPADQLLFLKTETLFAAPERTTAEVLQFLNVQPGTMRSSGLDLASANQSTIPEEDRIYLSNLFAEDIEAVEYALGWNCADWL